MSAYSKYNNLKNVVMLSPNEKAQSDDSEAKYWKGQAQYEQADIKNAEAKTGEKIGQGEDLNALWDSAKQTEDLSALWDSAKPTKPINQVTVNGKTYTASKNTFADDLKAELAANPVGAKLAAFGTAASDMYQGGKELLGIGDQKSLKRDIAANKVIREANPGSALAGNVGIGVMGGTIAPALNTLKGLTATGAVMSGLSPTENGTWQEHAGNALIGGASSVAGAKVLNGIGNAVTNSKAANAVAQKINATKDASLKAAQDAGFQIPRSLYNPSWLSNSLESFGGKAAVKQAATDENQQVVNNLTRKALGVPSDTPLSVSTVEGVRKAAYKPYEEIASLSTGAKNTLEDLKQNRADATAWFNSYNRSANPTDLAKAKEYQQVADIADNVLEDYAKNANRPELISQLKDARKTIAKTYTIERAMKNGSGDIDANVLGRLYDKKKPLSDGLDQIGQFASTFGKVAPNGKGNNGAGISALNGTASILAGLGGMYGSESPYGAAAGLLPLIARPAARGAALSKLMQKAPDYSTSKSAELLKALATARYSPMALTTGASVALTK